MMLSRFFAEALFRYLELTRPCAFITASCEHVEEAIRFIDAMMDTEMQADLYYGPQNPTEGMGWVYNEGTGNCEKPSGAH